MVLQSGTKQDLSYKLEIASRIKDKLGLTLVMHDLVDAAIVEKALNDKDSKNGNSANVRSKRSLAEILVEDYDIDHDIIYKTTASVYGFREISLDESDFQDNRIDFIKKMFEPLPEATRDYMISRKIIPFRYDPSNPYKLIFIAADPTDRMISAIARAMKVKSFDVCYAPLDPVSKLLDRVFPPENEFLKDLEHEMEFGEDDFEEEEFDEAQIEAEINKSLLVNLVEGMLIEAVRKGASDIHIVPAGSSTTEIHFRIDGTLRPWHMQEGIRPEAITAVMKDRAKNIDRFEREKAQDGFIQRKVDGHMIRFRVSTIPIVGSEYLYKFESIVIRILDDRQVITDLDKLGFHGRARQMFVKAIKQPQGMVIVTGPTGSGKSTTLIAALSHIVNPEVNVLTVEDPVEYIIPGVRQLKIGHKMTFDLALRSILRHDPDVVMVGEIRDKETGETAIKLANTGHLTFSTLHTNDAPSAVSRMYKMGIETFLIAYAINLIIAQRLMRKLCKHCKSPIENPDKLLLGRLGFSPEEIDTTTFYNAVGCEKCHHGYKGRLAIHEALYFTKEVRRKIIEARHEIDEESIRQQAIEDGMQTLQMSACQRAIKGETTIDEIARVTVEN